MIFARREDPCGRVAFLCLPLLSASPIPVREEGSTLLSACVAGATVRALRRASQELGVAPVHLWLASRVSLPLLQWLVQVCGETITDAGVHMRVLGQLLTVASLGGSEGLARSSGGDACYDQFCVMGDSTRMALATRSRLQRLEQRAGLEPLPALSRDKYKASRARVLGLHEHLSALVQFGGGVRGDAGARDLSHPRLTTSPGGGITGVHTMPATAQSDGSSGQDATPPLTSTRIGGCCTAHPPQRESAEPWRPVTASSSIALTGVTATDARHPPWPGMGLTTQHCAALCSPLPPLTRTGCSSASLQPRATEGGPLPQAAAPRLATLMDSSQSQGETRQPRPTTGRMLQPATALGIVCNLPLASRLPLAPYAGGFASLSRAALCPRAALHSAEPPSVRRTSPPPSQAARSCSFSPPPVATLACGPLGSRTSPQGAERQIERPICSIGIIPTMVASGQSSSAVCSGVGGDGQAARVRSAICPSLTEARGPHAPRHLASQRANVTPVVAWGAARAPQEGSKGVDGTQCPRPSQDLPHASGRVGRVRVIAVHEPATDPSAAWTEPAGYEPLFGCSLPSPGCSVLTIDSGHGEGAHGASLGGGCEAGICEASPSCCSGEEPPRAQSARLDQRRSSRRPQHRHTDPVESFHEDQGLRIFFAAEAQTQGLLCLRMGRGSGGDSRTREMGGTAPPVLEEFHVSAHARIWLGRRLGPHEVPEELTRAVEYWKRCRARARVIRSIRTGALSRPPRHRQGRHPLFDGEPPEGMHLLLLPRAPARGTFWEVVAGNKGPRRTMPAAVTRDLREWGLLGTTGCITMAAARRLRSRGARTRLTSTTVAYTLCRHRDRHLVLLRGPGKAPQFLSTRAALALMGISRSTAPRQYRWLVPAARARGPSPVAALSMIGAAIHLGVVSRILKHADKLVRTDVPRRTCGEHFAGLAVATAAAMGVWPAIAPTAFSEQDAAAVAFLRAAYPRATRVRLAESTEARHAFRCGLFLLIAGFPCEKHSALSDYDWADVTRDIDRLLQALQVLASYDLVETGGMDLRPVLVLLENVEGILYGAYDRLSASLWTMYSDYTWFVGWACPSEHGESPGRRRRVYWLAVRVDCLADRGDWPELTPSERLLALRPPVSWGRLRGGCS